MNLIKNPELACEITLQPLESFNLDSAIIFSDILVITELFGIELEFIEKVGPVLSKTLRTEDDLKKINTDEADRLNLLGFTARKSGNLTAAADFYEQALALNPRHTGALEYQGELFIQLGKIELAKANLEKIDKICWLPCNAERDLKKAIEKSTAN